MTVKVNMAQPAGRSKGWYSVQPGELLPCFCIEVEPEKAEDGEKPVQGIKSRIRLFPEVSETRLPPTLRKGNVMQLVCTSPIEESWNSYALLGPSGLGDFSHPSKAPTYVASAMKAGAYAILVRTHDQARNFTRFELSPFVNMPGIKSGAVSESAPPAYVFGFSQVALTAAIVLRAQKRLLGFIDPTGDEIGSRIFKHPVVSPQESRQQKALVLAAPGESIPEELCAQAIDLDLTSNNELRRSIERMNAIQIFRCASYAYTVGLEAGSLYLEELIYRLYNCRIPRSVTMGSGVQLGYGGLGVVVHKDSIIGNNVIIGQNVTLGSRGKTEGTPRIGDGVFIGPNTVFFGGAVGDGATIGAGSVVLKSVDARAVVAGNPARLIRYK